MLGGLHMMNPNEYFTKWHSFENEVVPSAKVAFVPSNILAIEHICEGKMENAQRKSGLGPNFFGQDFQVGDAGARIILEQPIKEAPRSGYCKLCQTLWVAQDV